MRGTSQGQRDAEREQSLESIGRNAYESIVEMVSALECDYDRLEELKDDLTCIDRKTCECELAQEWRELTEAAGECTSREDAEQRIHEDALSVEVRSGWQMLGSQDYKLEAEEFKILLTTGGPAVQIRGELDECKEPSRAWLETQDWGTPWTQYFGASQETLLTYCRCFYFGEG